MEFWLIFKIVASFLAFVAIVWIVLVVLASRASIKSLGAPTDELARIDRDKDDISARINATSEAAKKEMANARPSDLLATLRDLSTRKRMRDDKK